MLMASRLAEEPAIEVNGVKVKQLPETEYDELISQLSTLRRYKSRARQSYYRLQIRYEALLRLHGALNEAQLDTQNMLEEEIIKGLTTKARLARYENAEKKAVPHKDGKL